jgi:hypothetical protein
MLHTRTGTRGKGRLIRDADADAVQHLLAPAAVLVAPRAAATTFWPTICFHMIHIVV